MSVPSEASYRRWSKKLTHDCIPKKFIKGEAAQSRAWSMKKKLMSWGLPARLLMSASSGQQVQSLRPPDLQGNKSSLFLHFSIFRATTASFQAFGHTSDPGQGENNKQLQVKLHIVHAHPPEKQLAKTWDRCWQQFSSYLRKQKLHKN